MRKILNLLGTMALSTTASASVIACGGKIEPSIQKNDISTEIPNSINLQTLSANTTEDFLKKLQENLKKFKNLSTITTNDYNVYIAGTTTAIQENDIIFKNILNIKIVAKSKDFKGTKDNISIEYTKQLSSILTDIDLGTINIPQTIIDDNDNSKIKTLIISYLKSNNKNHKLWTDGVNVYYIIINEQNIGTAKIESNSKKYYNGNVDISFTVSKEKIDLSKLLIDQQKSINADISKRMSELDISQILLIFDKIRLTNPTIEYQDNSGKNISNEMQQKRYFQIQITANSTDPIYKGILVEEGAWLE